jgi:hypothetical protein
MRQSQKLFYLILLFTLILNTTLIIMKKIIITIASALICAASLTSCQQNKTVTVAGILNNSTPRSVIQTSDLIRKGDTVYVTPYVSGAAYRSASEVPAGLNAYPAIVL